MNRKYFKFSGCDSRSEWWAIQFFGALSSLLVIIPALLLDPFVGDGKTGKEKLLVLLWGIWMLVWFVVWLYVTMAANARRYHSRGRSGWHQLWVLVPYLGIIIVIVELGFLRERWDRVRIMEENRRNRIRQAGKYTSSGSTKGGNGSMGAGLTKVVSALVAGQSARNLMEIKDSLEEMQDGDE